MAEKKPVENKVERAPIVAVMGHIDHGKSTLLDTIRTANTVDTEAGGITQRVSAYEVEHSGKKITFIDTPGHEAFQTMRERGATIADIAILVVAADDGVKTQTLEALRAITESKIPYIVAINKIDKEGASVDRAKQTLAEANVLVEGYGGNIPCVPVSAKTGVGIPELLDMIVLVAEVEELQGTRTLPATGYVLESSLDPKTGPLATLIITDGTLHTGDSVVAGMHSGKLRKIEDFQGEMVKTASFSSPVRVFGFSSVPKAGEIFRAFSDKKEAERYASTQQEHIALKNTPTEMGEQNTFTIPVAIKADSFGTLEAVRRAIEQASTDKVTLSIIHEGVGALTENDIKTASGSGQSLVLGFAVKIERAAQDLAERLGITVMTFDIIYKLSEWLAEEVLRRTPKERVEEVLGHAKILKIFTEGKGKQVVGGEIQDGILCKDAQARVLRRGNEVGRSRVIELQKNKVVSSEVSEGQFGSLIKSDVEVAAGDVLEVFAVVER